MRLYSSSHTWSFLVEIARVRLHCDGSLGERGRWVDAVDRSIGAIGNRQVLAKKEGFAAGNVGRCWAGQSVPAANDIPDPEINLN